MSKSSKVAKHSIFKMASYLIAATACLFVIGSSVFGSYYYSSDAFAKSNSIKLTGSHGSCSGVEIIAPSGKRYILSAGHCRVLSDNGSTILTETENHVKAYKKILSVDEHMDLMLLDGADDVEGIGIAKEYADIQHVRTFTHGAGLKTYKTEGYLLEIVDIMINGLSFPMHEMITTALIIPGSSGGMAINDSGELIGICSASGNGFGFLVPLDYINQFLAKY